MGGTVRNGKVQFLVTYGTVLDIKVLAVRYWCRLWSMLYTILECVILKCNVM